MSDDKQANDILHELQTAHKESRLTKNSTTLFLKAANEIEGLRSEVAELEEELDAAINDIACYEAMREGFTIRATDMEARIAELEVALLCERCNGRGWYIVSDGSDQGMKVACLKCKAAEIRRAANAMEGRDG